MPDSSRFAVLRHRSARQQILLLPVALLLTACATPPSEEQKPTLPVRPAVISIPSAVNAEIQALQSLVAQKDRLYRVAGPLLVNNRELCKNHVRNLIGFTASNKHSFSTDLNQTVQNALKLDERLQVMSVLPGSGAERIGVQTGDILLAIEDRELPAGRDAERQASAILAPMVTGRSSVKLTVLRKGNTHAMHVALTPACAFGIELGYTDNVIAYADGHRILISRGMMNYARSDDELAYVIAKEMAHNILGHPSKLRINATIGSIIDNLARLRADAGTIAASTPIKPIPQDLDAMADKLSLYMVARAGYSIDQAIPFWQRMASQYPATVASGYTSLHPSTSYRTAAMEKTLADIRAKQAAKRLLIP